MKTNNCWGPTVHYWIPICYKDVDALLSCSVPCEGLHPFQTKHSSKTQLWGGNDGFSVTVCRQCHCHVLTWGCSLVSLYRLYSYVSLLCFQWPLYASQTQGLHLEMSSWRKRLSSDSKFHCIQKSLHMEDMHMISGLSSPTWLSWDNCIVTFITTMFLQFPVYSWKRSNVEVSAVMYHFDI